MSGSVDPLAHEGLKLVLFSLGQLRCAIEARWVAASAPLSRSGGESGAPEDWHQGWRMFGLDEIGCAAGSGPDQWLGLRWPGGECRLAVSGPLDLCAVSPAKVHPVPVLLAARCRLRGLCAIVVAPELSPHALTLLDPRGLNAA